MRRTLQAPSLTLAAGVASADVVVLDTITPGTWQGHPGWGIYSEYNPFGISAVGLRVQGNGLQFVRLGLIVSLWDGSTQLSAVSANDAKLHVRAFARQQDFLGANWSWAANPMPTARSFINPNWNVPIGTFVGVRYYYVEVDISDLAIKPALGQEVILAAAYQNQNAGLPHAGLLQGARGGTAGGDLAAVGALGYFGSSAGFIAQYGDPPEPGVPNVAARVWAESSPCPADLNADTFVDDSDFVVFAAAYNLLLCSDPAMPAACPADLNRDGFVDDTDFVMFATAYNELICP